MTGRPTVETVITSWRYPESRRSRRLLTLGRVPVGSPELAESIGDESSAAEEAAKVPSE
jgi:hypothetical protein